jgi:hypothetical protein
MNPIQILRANAYKSKLAREYAKGDPFRLSDILPFVMLPDAELLTITKFRENDWFAYGAAREYEYYQNRDDPTDLRVGKELLTSDEYDKWIKPQEGGNFHNLTYELYRLMSVADDKK